MVEYLEARADEPCGKTCLKSAQMALRFMEQTGGVAIDARLADHPWGP